MKIKAIVAGNWYETAQGIGRCIKVGGTFPPSVQIRITLPRPRGVVYLAPRDVLKEVPAPDPA